ncbi:MAG: hypothetical protein AVDCRST_MAG73-2404 [uncultured Thermomicrobiales bacterium]|uniref:Uncharacterized protein n=1 Tax=uncultured Thermomicrobiales bacterium TaxID=1645740 RepID=A0A6J4UE40_9BACT|nr:MAG: hypothetical protein AVDCRST_MAG73-2404 [uncultured Thermomicrobiales bacterium]
MCPRYRTRERPTPAFGTLIPRAMRGPISRRGKIIAGSRTAGGAGMDGAC